MDRPEGDNYESGHEYGPEDDFAHGADGAEAGSEENWDDDKGDETVELALADDDDRLPWLESGEYDEEDRGVDGARIFGFALIGLLAIALLIGLIWWLSHRGPDPELVADGSTIEAPEGAYKERPADPGGKTFEGTGDTSFAVGEGQSREGRLAEGNAPANPDESTAAPKPSIDTAAQEGNASGGVGVQVGAYSSREAATAGWGKLMRQTDKLAGVKYRVVEGEADIGHVYRLQAVAGDRASADRLCAALKGDGVSCQVK
ncbi:MAG: SPOR domain-containing protein [Sphingomonadales bacterium]|nr:SPOR domain-containing protein [Sphingomonadales bacterium]MBD3773710.1 SPOR domain-containing protein [Paracoccaceae bacterium]